MTRTQHDSTTGEQHDNQPAPTAQTSTNNTPDTHPIDTNTNTSTDTHNHENNHGENTTSKPHGAVGNRVTEHNNTTYECNACGERYPHEAFTRAHITLSDDDTHGNQNGFMPEATITKISTDTGDETELQTRPRDWNLETDIDREDVPNEHDNTHKCIIIAACREHTTETYTDITNTANDILQEHDHDTVSYATARRITRAYYTPKHYTEPMTTTTHDDDATLQDATTTQQAVLTALTIHADETNTRIADRTNVAKSYPGQIKTKYESVLNDVKREHANGKPVSDILTERLSADDIQALHDTDALENIDINTSELTPRTDTEPETNADTDGVVDRPVTEQHTVMSATPQYAGFTPTADNDTETTPTNNSTTNTNTDDDETDGGEPSRDVDNTQPSTSTVTRTNNDDADIIDADTIPVAEIIELRDHIEFYTNVVERVPDTVDSTPTVPAEHHIALCDTVLEELNTALTG